MSTSVKMDSHQLTTATARVSRTVHRTTIPIPKRRTLPNQTNQHKRASAITQVEAHREEQPPWESTHYPRISPVTDQRPISPQGPQARPTSGETPPMGLSQLAQDTPSGNPQDGDEPAPQGGEGIPQHMPHRRFTRPTGISAMRGTASAWISFFDAYRH